MKIVFSEDPVLTVWWGTRVECDSAIARLEREGHLTVEGTSEALSRLDDLATLWHEIQPVDILRDTARRVLRLHNLRAADALQLAAASLAAEQRTSTLKFVCLDQRLARAAAREGFVVKSD